MSDLRVVPFTRSHVADVPAGLRDLADLIETGIMEGSIPSMVDVETVCWVSVNKYGEIDSGMIGGDANRWKAIGLFHAGAHTLLGGQK